MIGRLPRATMSSMAARALDIFGRIESCRRVDEIDHVIAHPSPVFGAWFIGRDVESLVHLPRVGDDDLTTGPEGQLERQGRLANACRADDDGNAGYCRIIRGRE